MHLEIERKFLVASDGWRSGISGERQLRDGLVGPYGSSKVRVRRDGEQAWLTVKGPRTGLSRLEFEYPIPTDHADEMLRSVCSGEIVEKVRYQVPHAGLIWEVDVYEGRLAGIVLTEVELESEDHPLEIPGWVGAEVSGDPRFKKANLLKLRREADTPLTTACILALQVAS